MKKTDKKLDNQIVRALALVCETAKDEMHGFIWLTHFVDYQQFPGSLSVVCIFETQRSLAQAIHNKADDKLSRFIESEFKNINIHCKDLKQPVLFATEEACIEISKGNWQTHFKKLLAGVI